MNRFHRQAVENDQRRRRIALWLEMFEALNATRATTPAQQRLKEIAIERHFEKIPE